MNILIDAGHTADRAREYPSWFTVDWNTEGGLPAQIPELLGFKPGVKDSLEHIINVAVAKECARACVRYGIGQEVVDWPEEKNDAEISRVVKYANTHRQDLLLSIHCNAQGGAKSRKLGGSASGSVVLHYPGSSTGKLYAETIGARLRKYRKETGGPDNRADLTATSKVAVLRGTSCPAVLVEVGFYDNMKDLEWMARHIAGIGEQIVLACAAAARK